LEIYLAKKKFITKNITKLDQLKDISTSLPVNSCIVIRINKADIDTYKTKGSTYIATIPTILTLDESAYVCMYA
jgi:hypothetical protein